MVEIKRVVITGGPGSGKTSLCDGLAAKGHTVFPEYSRVLIQEQLQVGGRALPWDNLPLFSEKVIEGRIEQWKQAKQPVQLFDRSIVDSLAYLHKDGLDISADLWALTRQYRYHSVVLIAPPWAEIYQTDAERKETFETAVAIFDSLKVVYQMAGYDLLYLPLGPVGERVAFVEAFLNTL